MAKVLETSDYSKFDLCTFNRDVRKTKDLRQSMKKYGWIDAYPMHCIPNGGKRLKIKAGHHRFEVAQDLGIPVKYVVCDDTATIHELEKGVNPWKLADFLVSFCKCGEPQYAEVEGFQKRTGIPLSGCIALLAGNIACSGNYNPAFKCGTYNITHREYAEKVADLVIACKNLDVPFARHAMFVNALSRCATLDKFNVDQFIKRVETNAALLKKQASLEGYMELIETVYNTRTHTSKRLPLRFLVREMMQKRNVITSGKRNADAKPAKL